MTDRELMQQALEALKSVQDHRPNDETNNAITALRKRLAQPEQEPAAWAWYVDSGAGYASCGTDFTKTYIPFARHIPLYTAPPQRKPLTEEEIEELSRTMVKGNKSVNWLCRALEAAHNIGEKE